MSDRRGVAIILILTPLSHGTRTERDGESVSKRVRVRPEIITIIIIVAKLLAAHSFWQ